MARNLATKSFGRVGRLASDVGMSTSAFVHRFALRKLQLKSIPSSATSHPASSIASPLGRVLIENRVGVVHVSIDLSGAKMA